MDEVKQHILNILSVHFIYCEKKKNEKISRSVAIGWIALVGLSICCAERF